VPEIFGFDQTDTSRISAVVRAHESGRLTQRDLYEDKPQDRNFARIPFRNDSGEVIPAYGLLRITGMATVDGRNIWKVEKPDATYRRRYLVAAQEVGIGKRGWGTWLWHADYVLYDTGNTPAFGEEWGPEASSWTIKKDSPGFTIQGGNTGTGAASRTIAIQDVPQIIIGKADALIANLSSGTVRVYGGTQGSEADTGLTIASCYNYGPEIADEAVVSVGWMSGKPYAALMSCPA
jgi:hypothetical protein